MDTNEFSDEETVSAPLTGETLLNSDHASCTPYTHNVRRNLLSCMKSCKNKAKSLHCIGKPPTRTFPPPPVPLTPIPRGNLIGTDQLLMSGLAHATSGLSCGVGKDVSSDPSTEDDVELAKKLALAGVRTGSAEEHDVQSPTPRVLPPLPPQNKR